MKRIGIRSTSILLAVVLVTTAIVVFRNMNRAVSPASSPSPVERQDDTPVVTDAPSETSDEAIRTEAYTVRAGDSLFTIASRRYDTTDRRNGAHWLAIFDFNVTTGAIDPRRTPITRRGERLFVDLEIGQKLRIPYYRDRYPDPAVLFARYGVVDITPVPSPRPVASERPSQPAQPTSVPRAERPPQRLHPPPRGPTSPGQPPRATQPGRPLSRDIVEPGLESVQRPAESSLPAFTPPTPTPPSEPVLTVDVATRLREYPPPAGSPAPPPIDGRTPVDGGAPVDGSAPIDRPAPPQPDQPPLLVVVPERLRLLEGDDEAEESREPEQPDRAATTPELFLTSPGTEPGDPPFYNETLSVEGRVTAMRGIDASESELSIRRLEAYFADTPDERVPVYWDVLDGTFRSEIDTADRRGAQTLVLEAENSAGAITTLRIAVYDGNTEPEIALTAPDIQYGFGAFLEIAGTATDRTQRLGQPHGVTAVTYQIEPADFAIVQDPVVGELTPEPDGSFRTEIPTDAFRAAQLVTLRARSAGGAVAELQFEIEPADTAIPRIAAIAGDGIVTVDWSLLPGEGAYTIHYRAVDPAEPLPGDEPASAGGSAADGSAAGGSAAGGGTASAGGAATTERLWERHTTTTITDVRPPFTVTGLDNAVRYEFQVVSGERGREAWSAMATNVPLTGTELSLTSRNGFEGIDLEWTPVPSISRYTVWRRADSEDRALAIATVTGDCFRDENVRYGVRYTYRVAPDLPDAVPCNAVYGMATAVPQDAVTEIAVAETEGISRVTVVGEYIAVADGTGLALVDIWNAPEIVRRGSVPRVSDTTVLTSWDRYIAALDRTGGVRVIDTVDAARPRIVHRDEFPGVVDLAFVPTTKTILLAAARGDGGIDLFEFTAQPVSLTPAARISDTTSLRLAALPDPTRRDLFFLASMNAERIVILTVTADGRVIQQRSIPLPGVTDIDLVEDPFGTAILLAVTGDEFVVVDPGIEGESSVLSRMPVADSSAIRGVSYADGSIFAYVGSTTQGMVVFDITDLQNPVQFAATAERRSISSLAIHRDITGDVTVVAVTATGTVYYEAYTIGRSRTVASIRTPGRARSVRCVTAGGDDLILVADGGGVAILPAAETVTLRESDAAPQRYLSVGTAVRAVDTVASEAAGVQPLLVIADEVEGVFVYDLTDLTAPVSILSADIRPIDILGSRRHDGSAFAYVLDARWGIITVDLSNPAAPVQRSATRSPAPRAMSRLGERIYLADAEEGIIVIDISDPDIPRRDYTVPLPGAFAVDAVHRADGRLVVAALTSSHFVVFSGATGSDERLVRRGAYATRFAETVRIDEEYTLLSEGVLALNVLDLSDLDHPRRISGSDVGFAADAVRYNRYAIVTDGSDVTVVEILIPPWLTDARANR